jgi:hypothetical protein
MVFRIAPDEGFAYISRSEPDDNPDPDTFALFHFKIPLKKTNGSVSPGEFFSSFSGTLFAESLS